MLHEDPLWDALHEDEGFRAAVRMADPRYGVDSSIVNQIISEVVRVVRTQDCGADEVVWTRCPSCPTTGPCACSGVPCCRRHREEED